MENDVVKETVYDELVKKVNAIQTNDASNLVRKADYDTKIVEIEGKFPNHYIYITAKEIQQIILMQE